MPGPIQVVIDTNVFLGALRSRSGASYALFQNIRGPRWMANLSVSLALEYEEIAHREKDRLQISDTDIELLLNNVIEQAARRAVYFKWPLTTSDPDDEMIIELAVAARADYIITFNTRNFSEARRFGIKVVKPGEFLDILRQ